MSDIVFSEENYYGTRTVRLNLSISKQEKLIVMHFSDIINHFAMNKDSALQLIEDIKESISKLDNSLEVEQTTIDIVTESL